MGVNKRFYVAETVDLGAMTESEKTAYFYRYDDINYQRWINRYEGHYYPNSGFFGIRSYSEQLKKIVYRSDSWW